MSTAFVFLAPGFEEVEALTPVDLLRRAGVEVRTISLGDDSIVSGSHGIGILCDQLWSSDLAPVDLIVLPGGMPGAANLGQHQALQAYVKEHFQQGRLLGALCAAPVVAIPHLMVGRRFTCFPGLEGKAPEGSLFQESPVVEDGQLITSRGLGTAGEFGLALVARLLGAEAAQSLGQKTLILD